MFLCCVPVLSCVLLDSPKKQWKRHLGGREGRALWRIASHSVFLLSSFSLYKRCLFSVKRRCFSTPFQWADTPTVRCWNWQKTLSVRSVVVPVNSKSTTWKGWFFYFIFLKYILSLLECILLTTSLHFYSSLTSPEEMNNLQMGKHALFVVHSDCVCFGSHSNVLFLQLNKHKWINRAQLL